LPHFTLPFGSSGPVINAFVGLSGPRYQALTQAGQQTPAPVAVRALIDTGASCTCVDTTVLNQLALTPTGTTLVHTPTTGGTPQQVNQYDVGLLIPAAVTGHAPLVQIVLPVTAHALAVQGIQALIGRDVLSQCLLAYNGAMGIFTLGY
jgi:hypothetical protein